jgi:hypothetical protein
VAIETFAVGPHSATWNATALGLTKDGYRISHDLKHAEISESDLYGDSMLDTIWRGANVACNFTLLAFSKGTTPFSAFSGALYTLWTTAKPIGTLGSDVAQAFVMTATANTPAAAAPATITAAKAIVAPNFSTEHLYDSRLRDLPMRFQFLPYLSTNIIFAVTT